MKVSSLFLASFILVPEALAQVGTITGFRLLSAPNGTEISKLTNNSIVYFNNVIPPGGLTVVADTTGTIRSVAMAGAGTSKKEKGAPYALCGGSYTACPTLVIPGTYTVTATPRRLLRKGTPASVSFSLVAGPAPGAAPTASAPTAPKASAPTAPTGPAPTGGAPQATAPTAAAAPQAGTAPSAPAAPVAGTAPSAPSAAAPTVASAPAATAPTVAAAPKAPSAVADPPKAAPVVATAPKAPTKAPVNLPPIAQPPGLPIKINCGATVGQYKDWAPDAFFGGTGGVYTVANGTDIKGTEDDFIYLSERNNGANGPVVYEIPVPNSGLYAVVLHFAEIFYEEPKLRVFNVLVENSTLISDIDIVAATGSVNAKLTKTATVSVTDGKLSIQLISLVENAVISAIEISAVAPGSPIGTPVGPPVAPPVTAPLTAPIYISAGDKIAYNGTTNFWVADTAFASGGSFSFPIADSQPINNTIEDGLYRKERWGLDMKYAIPIANGSYKVTLHFAELFAGAASVGGRVFKATLESGGPNAVTSADIDIYKAVGAMFTAHTVTLAVTVSDGVLNVAFLLGAANNPQLCGIEIQKA